MSDSTTPTSTTTSTTTTTDDKEWLFESIIGFLKSPLWVNPIHSFIDENCLIFNTEDENKFTYTEVHNNFRDMIDNLLDLHLQEMGVSPEQVCRFQSKMNTDSLSLSVYSVPPILC